MPLKYVTIPEAITLLEPTTKEPLKDEKGVVKPVTFYDFIGKLLFNPKWAENYKAIKAAKAIDKAFEKAAPKTVVQLAEEDWKRLHDLIENPAGQYGYHAAVMPQLLPFLDAIMEASDKEPTSAAA
jgi:hypothetical protein